MIYPPSHHLPAGALGAGPPGAGRFRSPDLEYGCLPDRRKISSRQGRLAVHIYGLPVDMDPILSLQPRFEGH